MFKFNKTLIASALSVCAMGANAAFFQLAEISTSGLGMAYAGNAAVADNASVVATNPALMTKFKTAQLSAGAVLAATNVDIKGNLYGVNADHKSVVPTTPIPNAYFLSPVTDNFWLGGGVNVNYGLRSDYDPSYSAGMYGGTTKLQAPNLNLSGAYDFKNGFSFGAGFNAVYAKAELIRHLGVGNQVLSTRLSQLAAQTGNTTLAGVAAQVGAMPNGTEVAHLKGPDWGVGWNVGFTYDFNENNRIGFAYHSPIDIKFSGDYYSNGFPTAYNSLLAQLAAAGVNLPMSTATGSEKINGHLTLYLPAFWEVSGWHKLSDRWAMQYSWKYTEWSRLKSLTAYNATDSLTLLHKDESLSNSHRVSLGFSYEYSPELTLRTGFAYDENASKKAPSISIPDTDRIWLSVGATYRFTPNLSSDIGYSYLKGRKRQFTEGSAQFHTKASANLIGLNINYSF